MTDSYSIEEQKKIGLRISRLRESKNLSQTELADKIELNRSVLNKIEKGNRPTRDLELKRIAEVLNVSTDYLLGNTSKKNYYDLTEKEKVDLGKLADQLLEGSTTDAETDYFGEPSTEDQKANLRLAILGALELNKRHAKQKFTPKKYRDNNNENDNK